MSDIESGVSIPDDLAEAQKFKAPDESQRVEDPEKAEFIARGPKEDPEVGHRDSLATKGYRDSAANLRAIARQRDLESASLLKPSWLKKLKGETNIEKAAHERDEAGIARTISEIHDDKADRNEEIASYVYDQRKSKERVASLGSKLHEEWRKPRWREGSKDYEPRIKKTKDQAWSKTHGGAVEVDIANTPYEELPSEWQGENKISAEVAVTEVERALEAGEPLDESFIEAASSTLHDRWLERNGSWAPPEQNKPYAELSDEEKEKDRVIIKKAIEVCSQKGAN